jgi:hypothetical protein
MRAEAIHKICRPPEYDPSATFATPNRLQMLPATRQDQGQFRDGLSRARYLIQTGPNVSIMRPLNYQPPGKK